MPALEELSLIHSEPILAILRARHGRFNTRATPPLRDVLEEFSYDFHDAVALFDEHYGGLELAGESTGFDGTPVDESWSFDTAPGWMVGAGACLESRSHGSPRGDAAFLERYGDTLGLVPVAYGPQDDIWYLDRVGRGYIHDTCYDVGGPHLYASNPQQLFGRMILTAWCMKRLAHRTDGFVGTAVAEALELPPIPEASDASARWWGRGLMVVGEVYTLPGEGFPVRAQTLAGAPDKAGLAALRSCIKRLRR